MGVREILERTPVFSPVEAEVLGRLVQTAFLQNFSRGQYLWRAGDRPHGMTVVANGLVKVARPTPRGRLALCALFGAPGTVGDLALINEGRYPAHAVAATQSVGVIILPRGPILEALKQSRHFALSLARNLEEKVSVLHEKIDVLSAGSVEVRLATILLKLYARYGDDFDDGTLRVGVSLSRQDLADLVATSFETVIRVMTRWERDGVVVTDSEGFTIQRPSVLRVISGCETVPTNHAELAFASSACASCFK